MQSRVRRRSNSGRPRARKLFMARLLKSGSVVNRPAAPVTPQVEAPEQSAPTGMFSRSLHSLKSIVRRSARGG